MLPRRHLHACHCPPAEAHKLLSVVHVCLGETDAARAALARFLTASPDWTLAREAAIHKSVWRYDAGRERWLNSLRIADMPDTGMTTPEISLEQQGQDSRCRAKIVR